MFIVRSNFFDLTAFFRKGSTVLLAACWAGGFLSGGLFCVFCDHSFFSLMHRLPYCSVSIVGQILFPSLPFLFSAFAVFIAKPRLLLLIGFLKAFVFSLVSMSFVLSFGSSGWLLRLLLLFTDLCSMPLLFGYQRKCLHASAVSGVELLAALSLLILIGSVDCGYVLPFLADMIIS